MPGDVRGYRLRPAARADLEDIWRYSAERWSVDQANRYIALMIEAFDDLASERRKGRPVDVRPDYLKCACGSHMIYYRVAEGVDIVRILHQHMDVDRHISF